MYEIQLTRPRSGYFERRERTGRSSKTLAPTPSTLASFCGRRVDLEADQVDGWLLTDLRAHWPKSACNAIK